MTTRMTTRRARACAPSIIRPGDVELHGFLESAALVEGKALTSVLLFATVVDVGDPRFRLFLGRLCDTGTKLHIEIITRPDPS